MNAYSYILPKRRIRFTKSAHKTNNSNKKMRSNGYLLSFKYCNINVIKCGSKRNVAYFLWSTPNRLTEYYERKLRKIKQKANKIAAKIILKKVEIID